MRTLEALAWFFQVRVGYFTDDAVAAEVEQELQARQAELEARIKHDREGRADVEAAANELQQAMRTSGVTKMTHRAANSGMDFHQQASAMRALARDLLHDDEDEDEEDDDR